MLFLVISMEVPFYLLTFFNVICFHKLYIVLFG